MNLVLVTPPTAYPVTREEAKQHLKQDELDEDDALIDVLIISATTLAEEFTRRRFMAQTWKLLLDSWPDIIYLPYPPCTSITHVKYLDSNGTQQTLVSNTDYLAYPSDTPARIAPHPDRLWPDLAEGRLDRIEVQFVCGYGATADDLKLIKQSILIQIGWLYENRQTAPELCLVSELLLWPLRDYRF